MMNREREFAKGLMDWYNHNQRGLPWNETTDPYEIWVSEVILQQTQVVQGLLYYHRFLAAFPNVASLADATEAEVLKLWEGLGYYSRARNLLKAARVVMSEYRGSLPEERNELLKIPGIGPYTSSAIAAFAFNNKEAVVDGNVMRVLSRVFFIGDDISRTATKTRFEVLSKRILANHNPADYNRAIMDLGATICTPSQPKCEDCPVSQVCLARSKGATGKVPFNAKKLKRRERFFHLFLKTDDAGALIVRRRTGKGIWQGLYTPLMIEGATNQASPKFDEDTFGAGNLDTVELVLLEKVKHNLTHQALYLYFYMVNEKGKRPEILEAAIKEALERYAFPAPVRKALVKAGENKAHIDVSTKSAV